MTENENCRSPAGTGERHETKGAVSASRIATIHPGFTEAAVRLADHEHAGRPWWFEWPPDTPAQRRFRIRQLTVAANLLADDRIPEPEWIRVQLLDLRDLLAAEGVAA
ncbi:hypothetical protein EF847_00080 [Actinobacteria bacterium YIM 96077]|uniref:Uncharacterized protein n=1 Tax=Phytoactinopolyspora halophila TaxID=1981511 RepID=A0A329QVF2_9ACTN|nr:hypothetical protein [Phytoactinopolyspora halophila]AYY11353.1 hypothetical protein EF847_00080 [Actinobacteria bacterium YIM 96077]RAW14698.1 hypothetical protein DPM12_10590 [Phytoactinopolyspora halophila]